MRKAVKIVSIIYLVALGLAALIFFIVGGVMFGAAADPNILAEANVTQEEAVMVGTVLVVIGVIGLVGYVPTIACLVLSGKHPKPAKGLIITWGVIAILFASWVLGVLAIIWGAKEDAE